MERGAQIRKTLGGIPAGTRAQSLARRLSGLGLAAMLMAGLSACSPQEAADAVAYRAAEQVAGPIVSRYMQPAQAAGVTQCVLRAASGDELRSLAQDIGTRGGSRPQENLFALAARPAARQCILSAGLPQLPGVGL